MNDEIDTEIRRLNGEKYRDGEIAKMLAIRPRFVMQRRHELGLPVIRGSSMKRLAWADELIHRRHTEGWSDSEIAVEVGVSRRAVGARRNHLRLPHNRHSEHYKQRVGEATRRQCQKAGVKNLAEVRSKAFADYAESHGWPRDCKPREVHILESLYINGILDRRRLAVSIHAPAHQNQKKILQGGDNSYLGELQRKGLVLQTPRILLTQRIGRRKQSGKSVHLYRLSEQGLALKQRWEASHAQ